MGGGGAAIVEMKTTWVDMLFVRWASESNYGKRQKARHEGCAPRGLVVRSEFSMRFQPLDMR